MWHLGITTLISVIFAADAQKAQSTVNILDGYNKFEYPGTTEEPKVTVNHSLSLIRIKDFDSKNLLIDVWEQLLWVDPRLGWKEAIVKDTRLPSTSIWIPDVVLYNDPLPQPKYEPNAVIGPTGHVTLFIPTRFQTDDCNADDDVIRCHFKVGSWTYSGNLLDLQPISPKVVMDTFVENDKYEVVGTKVRRKVRRYVCCPEDYVDLTYTIKLKARK